MKSIDVLIIGAGPAGAAAARVLSLEGLQVIMADPVKTSQKIGESLPGAARTLLKDMGLIPWFEKSIPKICYGNLSSWGSEQLISADFIRDPNGTSWHLNRSSFDNYLREAAQNAGTTWLKLKLKNLKVMDSQKWGATFDGEEIESSWLIDASGRKSICTQFIGVKKYHDNPIVSVFTWGKDIHQEERTLIESVPKGWWYSSPLPQNKRIVSFHVTAKEAANIINTPNEWQKNLSETKYIKNICDAKNDWDILRRTMANGAILEQFGGKYWIAIGDAALAFDPISSQGIFNALYTGLRGAQAIISTFKGKENAIEEYSLQLKQIRNSYLKNIKYYYSQERRWKNSAFWGNR